MKNLIETVKKFKELQIFIKQLEEEAEAVKQEIIAEMDEQKTEVLIIDVFTIRNTTVTTNRFDSTAFKKTHEDLYSQYLKENIGKRFTIN
jgi:predicted phage-related endonuclease